MPLGSSLQQQQGGMRRHPKGRFQLTSCEPAQRSRALQCRRRGQARNWPQREPRPAGPALLFFWTGALGLLSGPGLAPFLLPHHQACRPLCHLCDSSDAGVPALPGCSAGPCGRGPASELPVPGGETLCACVQVMLAVLTPRQEDLPPQSALRRCCPCKGVFTWQRRHLAVAPREAFGAHVGRCPRCAKSCGT